MLLYVSLYLYLRLCIRTCGQQQQHTAATHDVGLLSFSLPPHHLPPSYIYTYMYIIIHVCIYSSSYMYLHVLHCPTHRCIDEADSEIQKRVSDMAKIERRATLLSNEKEASLKALEQIETQVNIYTFCHVYVGSWFQKYILKHEHSSLHPPSPLFSSSDAYTNALQRVHIRLLACVHAHAYTQHTRTHTHTHTHAHTHTHIHTHEGERIHGCGRLHACGAQTKIKRN